MLHVAHAAVQLLHALVVLLGVGLVLLVGARELFLSAHDLLEHGLLPDAQPRALLHEPAQVVDLVLELLDGLLGADLLLVGRVHHLPRLFHLLFQRRDARLVLLRQLERRLHFGRVVDDLGVQLAAFLDQLLLLPVRLLERAMELLVLEAEPLEALVAHELRQHFLEVILERLERRRLEARVVQQFGVARDPAAAAVQVHCVQFAH